MSNFGVKLALFYFSMPFFPRGKTSSSNAIASDCIPSIICEYVSIVKARELCPSASEITFGFAPLNSMRLAHVSIYDTSLIQGYRFVQASFNAQYKLQRCNLCLSLFENISEILAL
jgi:hypothetical protein